MPTTATTKRISSVFFLLFLCTALNSQVVLEGKVRASDKWRPFIYIEEQGLFNAPLYPTDSIQLDSSGSFRYTISKTKIRSKLIRVAVVPRGSGYQYFKEGWGQNIFTMILPDKGAVFLKADADSFYFSAKITGGQFQSDWTSLRKMKQQFNQIATDFEKQAQQPMNIDEKNALVSKFQRTVMSFLPQYAEQLQRRISSAESDYLKLLVMNDYYVTTMGNMDSAFWAEHLSRIKDTTIKAVKTLYFQLKHVRLDRIGLAIPTFAIKDSSGSAYVLRDHLGQINVIDFWASWCNPCRISIRERLPSIVKKYTQKGVQFIGISVDQSEESWRKSLIKDKPFWLQLIDNKEGLRFADMLKLYAFPTIIITDSRGVILRQPMNEVELEDTLEELTKETKKPALP